MEETSSPVNIFPNEIFLYIFGFLSAKQLVKCRQVCKRWKQLIEAILNDDNTWKKYCKQDFAQNVEQVRRNSPNCSNWYEIYKSLSLWQYLNVAEESIDEFCHSNRVSNEILDLIPLGKGLLAIHRRTSVLYYNLLIENYANRPIMNCDFNRFYERDNLLITHDNQMQLTVSRWKNIEALDQGATYNLTNLEIESVFVNAKLFVIHNDFIYFITTSNQIYQYQISTKNLLMIFHRQSQPSVVSMSVVDNKLYILSIDRRVCVYIDNELLLVHILDAVPNLLDFLWRFNFLETIDWRIFFIWMTQLQRKIPDGPLQFICAFKCYGDIFFVGSQCGVMRIYYKPFTNGELDLYNVKPIKQYNFSERIDIPILSLHPILKMEVFEVVDGHKLLVAMPRKILLIQYKHKFENKEKALLPYLPRDLIVAETVEHPV